MVSSLSRLLLISAGYFAMAGVTIAFTRVGEGFAALWFATSYLTAILAVRRRSSWIPICIACGLASVVATGALGLGWDAALPLAFANMAEAALAAHLIRRRIAAATFESLGWFGAFLLRIGIIAPAAGATIGSVVIVAISDKNILANWVTWYVGHALGALTFTPVALLLARGELSRWASSFDRRSCREPALLMALFLAATIFTFYQRQWPLLFFPLGPLMLICFRQDRTLSAVAVACLGVIGGGLTAVGHGPIHLILSKGVAQLQFFQFYMACVVVTILPVTADLRQRRQLLRALRESDGRFRLLLENSTDILLHLSPDGRIRYASPSLQAVSGREIRELQNRSALLLVDPDWHEYVRQCHVHVLAAGGEAVRFEYMAEVADGQCRWFETTSRSIIGDEGSVESVISVVRDIDVRKNEEFNLVLEASLDGLTGLANRRAFERAFDAAYGLAPLAIAIIDIDHFKLINDRFGHGGGDCALQTFAEVATRVVRKDDLVARIGGEEFAVLFRGMTAQQSFHVCERLRLELAEAVTFYGDQAIQFTVSVGVTEVRSPDLHHSLSRADTALYEAKRAGRDRLKFAA